MRTKLLGAALVAALFSSAPAYAVATLNGACTTDLTIPAGSSQLSCFGRDSGNVLNNASNTDINAALTALGYSGPAVNFAALPSTSILGNLNGSHTVDFPGLLNGIVYIGVHYGNGQGGPGNTTTFYKLSASNLDSFTLNLNASSDAALLATTSAVPEPATWAMMLLGLGGIGLAMRSAKARADKKFDAKIKRLAAGESA